MPLLSYTLLLCLVSSIALAQPNTEIYVFDLLNDGNSYTIENPFNVTYKNPGYDNQPHFLPDGSMYYVSTREGQTDIAKVEFAENSWGWLTYTKEGSEYSPTPIPNSDDFSAIRLDKTGLQLLYRYPHDMSEPNVLLENLKVGYHAWFDENMLMVFVLGEPPTLQACYLDQDTCKVIEENIGRSLHSIPNTWLMSFVSMKGEHPAIHSYDPKSGVKRKIINTLEGSEDMCWGPDGTIFMGQDSILYKYHAAFDKDWVKVADFSEFNMSGITRLAVNSAGDKIAVVVDQ